MTLRRVLALLTALAVFIGVQLLSDEGSAPLASAPVPGAIEAEAPADEPGARAGGPESTVGADLIVRDVTVRDIDGRVAWRGDVDLGPVLERVEDGTRDPHGNDGGVFGNREGLLPPRPRGHYREYVVRTPGIDHAGPQRVVLGADGAVYYTSDHYASFRRIR